MQSCECKVYALLHCGLTYIRNNPRNMIIIYTKKMPGLFEHKKFVRNGVT